jgi:xylan 1,4-beta-xylosidase
LLTIHGVAKPSYRAFELLHHLGTEPCLVDGLHQTVDCWVVRRPGGVTVLLSNHALPRHPIQTEQVQVRLTGGAAPSVVIVERIDDDHANAKRCWLDMGKPEFPRSQQVEQLREASQMVREAQPWKYEEGTIILDLALPPHAVAAVTVQFASALASGEPRP